MFIAFLEGRTCLLLMDGHGSHITPEVIKLATENNVILFTFAAHTSHACQPLDVSVYKSLKVCDHLFHLIEIINWNVIKMFEGLWLTILILIN